MAPEQPSEPVTPANLFRNSETHPLILHSFLLERYGPSWPTWMPDSIWVVIQKDFKTNVATLIKEKISAIQTLLMVDSFWRDWEVFEKVTQSVNGNIARFDILQPPTLGQMINAINIARKLRPDIKKFDEEVARYVSAIADEEGVELLPPPLDFGQIFLGKIPEDVLKRYTELTSSPFDPTKLKEVAPDVQAFRLVVAQAYAQSQDKLFNLQARALL
jgi:hypothetical protein